MVTKGGERWRERGKLREERKKAVHTGRRESARRTKGPSCVKNERSSPNDSSDGLYQEHASWFQHCLLGESSTPFPHPTQPHSRDTKIFNYRYVLVSLSDERKLSHGTFLRLPRDNKLLIVWCKCASFTARTPGRSPFFLLAKNHGLSNEEICIFKAQFS